MKNSTRFLILLIAGLFLFGTAAYAGNDDARRTGFADLNGDGLNDNMKDGDGDGIPDKLQADFEEGVDGNSNMNAYQTKEQAAEQFQLTFCWRTHEMAKQLYQWQYGELGEGAGKVNQNANQGTEGTGNKGEK